MKLHYVAIVICLLLFCGFACNNGEPDVTQRLEKIEARLDSVNSEKADRTELTALSEKQVSMQTEFTKLDAFCDTLDKEHIQDYFELTEINKIQDSKLTELSGITGQLADRQNAMIGRIDNAEISVNGLSQMVSDMSQELCQLKTVVSAETTQIGCLVTELVTLQGKNDSLAMKFQRADSIFQGLAFKAVQDSALFAHLIARNQTDLDGRVTNLTDRVLELEVVVYGGQALLKWNTVASAEKYSVYWSKWSRWTGTGKEGPTTTGKYRELYQHREDTGETLWLIPDSVNTVYFAVTASNKGGESAYSDEVRFVR